MNAKLIAFGDIEIDGQRYAHDMVIDGGKTTSGLKRRPKLTVRRIDTRRCRWGKTYLGKVGN